VLTTPEGVVHAGIVPVRAFPISAPEQGISLVGTDGHELMWIDRIADLPSAMKALIEDELSRREFMPKITHIKAVSSFATPSRWRVTTDRGETELLLNAEDHIRHLPPTALIITDGYGVSFIIQNIDKLDHASRKLLDRFL
jgi:hypothetical protein